MLPSLRLIAATFLCGFALVFAGLRLAAPLNGVPDGWPARAAPAAIADATDGAVGRGPAATPVIYDLRFAVRVASRTPAPVNTTALVIERSAPFDVGPALSVAPLQNIARAAATIPEPEPVSVTNAIVTAVPEQPAVGELPAAAPPAEAAAPGAPVAAVVDPPVLPPTEATGEAAAH